MNVCETGDVGVRLQIQGVHQHRKTDVLLDLVKQMDIRFPVLVDDPRLRWNVEQPSVLPTTLIINPEGELHKVAVGPQTYESLSRELGLTSET